MNKTLENAAIYILRDFAKLHGVMPFVNLCAAALSGERWAVERITPALDKWKTTTTTMAGNRVSLRLSVIRSTDCTRPDGAIARSFQV